MRNSCSRVPSNCPPSSPGSKDGSVAGSDPGRSTEQTTWKDDSTSWMTTTTERTFEEQGTKEQDPIVEQGTKEKGKKEQCTRALQQERPIEREVIHLSESVTIQIDWPRLLTAPAPTALPLNQSRSSCSNDRPDSISYAVFVIVQLVITFVRCSHLPFDICSTSDVRNWA